MSDLGSFIGKVGGKIMNVANSDRKLKCYDCQKITDHISISYADQMNSSDGDHIGHDILGVAVDLIPLVMPLLDGNPYACTVCQRIRWEGGILSNKVNKGRYYLK